MSVEWRAQDCTESSFIRSDERAVNVNGWHIQVTEGRDWEQDFEWSVYVTPIFSMCVASGTSRSLELAKSAAVHWAMGHENKY